jgi:EAL domain-containing protein (putative c-di-GMP-specific phosphodiesterase class I)
VKRYAQTSFSWFISPVTTLNLAYRCCRSTGSLAASASRFTDADQFIPLAEDGLIVAMSDVVLEKACKDMVHLSPDLVISVNISGWSLIPVAWRNGQAALQKSGLKPSRLELNTKT